MANPGKIDRQREHQANERTFLAWLRTAIALIGFGFAIARFGLFLRQIEISFTGKNAVPDSFINSQHLGISLVILGVMVIALSVWRYNKVLRQIEEADYKPSRLMVLLTAVIVMILGLLTIPFLLWRHTPIPNKLNPPKRKTNISSLGNKTLVKKGTLIRKMLDL
ncbi:YidH family protein [Floridanema aerugineum]|jgi:putative membrane protein|uniref:YidH family protein n=1 Tax=Floridaenema aerugineum BLCC-F46 TaxID=3153654 RepID=A0ABV4X753_9CYAN